MTPTLLPVVLAALFAADPAAADDAPRKSNPLAPSLPLLTSEEEEHLDKIIDRFMLFDTGQLKGAEGKAALQDFTNLGPEAIPALIRGINRAAVMDQSCPTLVIAKKLKTMLMASDDQDLLDFAHDNIAAGVERSQHMNVLQDLRVMCMLRRNALARLAERGPKPPRKMTTSELVDAAGAERGLRLKQVLTELAQRKGPDVLKGLVAAAGNGDREIHQLSLDLMTANLTRQGIDFVQKKLPDGNADVRQSAARAAAKFPSLAGDLIALLADVNPDVADAARQSLVQINGGDDLGASAPAWQAWWDKQRGK